MLIEKVELGFCSRILIFDMGKAGICIAVSASVIAIDQLSKFIIRSTLDLYERVQVLPFLNIVHFQNRGAAFGVFDTLGESLRFPLFILVLVAAVAVIIYFLVRASRRDRLLVTALSMILGGAIGNSLDRISFGFVTDFLDFHWFGDPKLHWAAFNIADAAITLGVAFVLFDSFRSRKGGGV